MGKSLRKNMGAAVIAAGMAILAGQAFAASSAPYEGTADDYFQIRQLHAKYTYAVNMWDGPTWASVFTEDGIFGNGPNCRTVGRPALSALLAKMGPDHAKDPIQQNTTVTGWINFVDKDHAWAHSTLMIVGVTGKVGPFLAGSGLSDTRAYDDTFKRVNGKWLIAQRVENTKTANFVPPTPCQATAATPAPTPAQ